jgi:adenosine deaminase
MGFMPLAQHPLPMLLEEGLLVSLSTDDPLMFGVADVRETFERVAGPLGLEEGALAQMTRNAIQTAFVSDERRRWLWNRTL